MVGIKLKKSSGFALMLGLVIAISVSTGLLMVQLRYEERLHHEKKALQAGSQLRMFAFGVMRLISDQGVSVATGAAPNSTAWLKPTSCGGTAVGDGYLPCSFPDKTPYGDDYATDISVSGANVTATISIPWPVKNGKRNGSLGSTVATNAASEYGALSTTGQSISPALLGWLTVTDPLDTIATKTTEVIVSTNANTDIFLHTNGSNSMNADLNVGGNSIVQVQDITALGTLNIGDVVATGDIQGLTLDATGSRLVGGRNVSITATNDIATSGQLVSNGGVDTNGNISLGDPGTVSSAAILFRQNAGNDSANVALVAESSTAGGNSFNDLRVQNVDGGDDVDLIANNVYNEDINRYMTQAVFDVTVVKVGDTVPDPNCPTPFTPQIFTSVDGVSNAIADPIELFDISPVWLGPGQGWVIEGEMVTTNYGRITGSDVKADIVAIVKCT